MTLGFKHRLTPTRRRDATWPIPNCPAPLPFPNAAAGFSACVIYASSFCFHGLGGGGDRIARSGSEATITAQPVRNLRADPPSFFKAILHLPIK